MWEYKYPITSDELYHYGVKGMKWGVRRYQNKDGTLTDVGKRRAQNVRSEARLISTTDGYILKKGTKVQRISNDAEDKVKEYTYVSFSKHDNDFYDKYFTEKLEYDDDTKDIYRNTLTTTKDLKIPSRDANKRIFKEMYEEHTAEMIESMATSRRLADINYYGSKYQFKVGSEKYNGDYKRAFDDATKYYVGRYSNMTIKQLQDDAYYDFMNSLASNSASSRAVRVAYFDKLKAKGYNAILDDNDSSGLGARGYKDEETPTCPLIILNASEVLKRTDSSVIKKGRSF